MFDLEGGGVGRRRLDEMSALCGRCLASIRRTQSTHCQTTQHPYLSQREHRLLIPRLIQQEKRENEGHPQRPLTTFTFTFTSPSIFGSNLRRTLNFFLEIHDTNRRLGRKDYSIPDKRGNSRMHNIQKCGCCQTSHFNAEGRQTWKC